MSNVPIVTSAGASMVNYCIFWLCISTGVLAGGYVLHRDLKAIATALTQLNETMIQIGRK